MGNILSHVIWGIYSIVLYGEHTHVYYNWDLLMCLITFICSLHSFPVNRLPCNVTHSKGYHCMRWIHKCSCLGWFWGHSECYQNQQSTVLIQYNAIVCMFRTVSTSITDNQTIHPGHGSIHIRCKIFCALVSK